MWRKESCPASGLSAKCRSVLGVPFNIASYAVDHMIAQQCDLDVGEFVHTFGDCHLYKESSDGRVCFEQLRRTPGDTHSQDPSGRSSLFEYELGLQRGLRVTPSTERGARLQFGVYQKNGAVKRRFHRDQLKFFPVVLIFRKLGLASPFAYVALYWLAGRF